MFEPVLLEKHVNFIFLHISFLKKFQLSLCKSRLVCVGRKWTKTVDNTCKDENKGAADDEVTADDGISAGDGIRNSHQIRRVPRVVPVGNNDLRTYLKNAGLDRYKSNLFEEQKTLQKSLQIQKFEESAKKLENIKMKTSKLFDENFLSHSFTEGMFKNRMTTSIGDCLPKIGNSKSASKFKNGTVKQTDLINNLHLQKTTSKILFYKTLMFDAFSFS